MTEFIVTGEVPVEVKVRDCVVAVFTVSLPKVRLGALTDNCGLGAVVPVPASATCMVLPVVELLLTVSWPLRVPAVVGSNCICRVSDCEGFRTTGKLCAIEKVGPVIVAEFTVTGEVPVEVSVRYCVAAVFTVTLPKLRLAALTDSCGLV